MAFNFFHKSYLIAIIVVLLCSAAHSSADPFKKIQQYKLNNGLEVILAPSSSADLVKIRIEVDVGWIAEKKSQWGAAHLLEHVLFRDPKFQDDMSYLQLIKEAGGDANGRTERRTTSYFASVPYKKGQWLNEQFYNMILKNKITEKFVETEKKTVLLEIGDPSPLASGLGFDISKILSLKYLEMPGFWKSEFGVDFDDPYSVDEERLSTLKLKKEDISQLYKDYYYPSNMRVFIAGRFNSNNMRGFIQKTWGREKSKKGKILPAHTQIQPSKKAYLQTKNSNNRPFISEGTKFWDISLEDEVVLDVYLQYLSHRLMKEIRNKKGETYGVSVDQEVYKRFGYGVISFETTDKSFKENRQILRNYIQIEAEGGFLTEKQFSEARSLYLKSYLLTDKSADVMMAFAQDALYINQDYKRVASPIELLESMDKKAFTSRLKTLFKPERRYSYTLQPPFLFKYEMSILVLLCFLFSINIIKQIFKKEFHHDRVSWVRKVRFPPFKIVEIGLVILGCVIYAHIAYFLNLYVVTAHWFQSSMLFSYYVFNCVSTFVLLFCIHRMLAFCPSKLMVVDEDLVIKSINYHSKHIPLSKVVKVKAKRLMGWPLRPKLWVQCFFGYKAFFMSPPWEKGLLIQLKDGTEYFYSVTEPEKAKMELRSKVRNCQRNIGEGYTRGFPLVS